MPAAPGDPAGVWELSRLAAPLPTILPSYNQIGFDSLHYLVGLVEGDGDGGAIAWVVGGRLAEGENRTVVDPATRVLFPLEVRHDGGLLTLINEAGFAIEFNGIRIPFELFRVATARRRHAAHALDSPALNALTPCARHHVLRPVPAAARLLQPGHRHPRTRSAARSWRRTRAACRRRPPASARSTSPPTPVGITATLTGTSLAARDAQRRAPARRRRHGPARLPRLRLHDRCARLAPDGTIASVRLPFPAGQVTGAVRAHLMVDAYPAATATLTVPAV